MIDAILARPGVTYPLVGSSARIETLRRTTEAPPLREAQIAMLSACEDLSRDTGTYGPRGPVLMVGCGHGKSLVSYLAPRVFGAKRPVLCVPAHLVRQTYSEMTRWSKWYAIDPIPRVVSYGTLSALGHGGELELLSPDLLILDEAHMLSNRDSARWLRIARFVEGRRQCRVMAMSGTLLSASIYQISHLMAACLRDLSPLPSGTALADWSAVLDLGSEPHPYSVQTMAPLADSVRAPRTQQGIREGFGALLRRSRGVHVQPGTSADVSLTLEMWRPATREPEVAQEARKTLASMWVRPDGAEIVDALEFDRLSRTLSLGIWHNYVEEPSLRWRAARSAWGRVVKALRACAAVDTPGEAQVHAETQGKPTHRAALSAWLAADQSDRPSSAAFWLDDSCQEYVRDVAREWRRTHRGNAILWTRTPVVGMYLSEALGIPYHGIGSAIPTAPAVVASVQVHGVGGNLQQYTQQLVMEPMGAPMWEQLLARTHRPGQTSDVSATVLLHCPENVAQWERARAGAAWAEKVSNQPQRLIYADRVKLS